MKCGGEEWHELETLGTAFLAERRTAPQFRGIWLGEESGECIDAGEIWGHAAVSSKAAAFARYRFWFNDLTSEASPVFVRRSSF